MRAGGGGRAALPGRGDEMAPEARSFAMRVSSQALCREGPCVSLDARVTERLGDERINTHVVPQVVLVIPSMAPPAVRDDLSELFKHVTALLGLDLQVGAGDPGRNELGARFGEALFDVGTAGAARRVSTGLSCGGNPHQSVRTNPLTGRGGILHRPCPRRFCRRWSRSGQTRP